MPISSFLPARFRGSDPQGTNAPPSYLNRKLSPLLQTLTRPACQHPIRTIVLVLVLASSSYIGLLEGSLFDAANANRATGHIDLSALVDGGRQLKLSEDTNWKWQADMRRPEDVGPVGYVLDGRCNSLTGLYRIPTTSRW
jgi:hydroxymethylglutaryl-CoA reductase (NADPH)